MKLTLLNSNILEIIFLLVAVTYLPAIFTRTIPTNITNSEPKPDTAQIQQYIINTTAEFLQIDLGTITPNSTFAEPGADEFDRADFFTDTTRIMTIFT